MYVMNRDHYPLFFFAEIGTHTDAELRVVLDQLRANAEADLVEGRRFVCVIDLRFLSLPPAPQRKMLLDTMQGHIALMRKAARGYVFIASSRALRGALATLLWFAGISSYTRMVATFDQALVASREMLDKQGIPWPKSLDNPQLERALYAEHAG